VESERELILEDARSIREGLWRMAQLAQDAAESLIKRRKRPGTIPRGAPRITKEQ
jgi:hypothetical protein